MGVLALVVQALRHLPGPIHRLLDAWSHRVALRRQRQRRQAWGRRRQAPAEMPPVNYKLKHWRD